MARRERAGPGRAPRALLYGGRVRTETGLDRPRVHGATKGMEAIANAVLGRWFRPAYRDAHPEVVARFRAMLIATPAEGYAACCDALADADLTARLAEITAPTLVLTGSDDPVVTPADGDALAAAIGGGAVHTVIDRAAHIANVEQPDAFTAALLRHLGGDQEDA